MHANRSPWAAEMNDVEDGDEDEGEGGGHHSSDITGEACPVTAAYSRAAFDPLGLARKALIRWCAASKLVEDGVEHAATVV